jgi:hypothetical protein
MIMKLLVRFLFLICFLFCSFFLKAQFNNEMYDKELFLIGTLNEYMGYQRTLTHADYFYYQRIDILSNNELKHTLFIESLFNTDYPDITIVNNGASIGLKMYSPSLSLQVDDYYSYAPSGRFSGQMDTVYAGVLKNEKFVTEKQMRSFILGAYLRYGRNSEGTNSLIQLLKRENLMEIDKEFNREVYAIAMTNAPTKAKLCAALLENLGCENVEFYYRKSIPAGNFVFFTPSQKIIDVINEAELLKGYIEIINTDQVEFTPNGDKFIWREPNYPSFK